MGVKTKDSRKRSRTASASCDEDDKEVVVKNAALVSPKQNSAKKRKTNVNDSFNATPKKAKTVQKNEDAASDKKKPQSKTPQGKAEVKKEVIKENENGENLKKKNKKKKQVEPTSVGKEENKMNKKNKKGSSFGVVDSKLLKEAGGEVKEPSSRINRAVDYMRLWKNDNSSWKFNTSFQALLLKAVYNQVVINDEDFEILLLYFEKSAGRAREKLRSDAMDIVNQEEDHLADPVDPDKEKRARAILQMLG